MTNTNEMPGVIWVYTFEDVTFSDGEVMPYRIWQEANPHPILADQYHHTAKLIERLEGMKERYTSESYRAALQDVIDILKGGE